MSLSFELFHILGECERIAEARGHEYITPELFLYILCKEKEFAEFYESLGGNIDELLDDLDSFFAANIGRNPHPENGAPYSHDMNALLGHAQEMARAGGREEVSVLHFLHGLIQLRDSHALYYIERQGIDPDSLFLALHAVLAAEDVPPPEEPVVGQGAKEKEDWRQFVTCLNDVVADEARVPLVGRTEELERLMLVLCRKEKNNPLLLGEPGVGKTAIALGFVKKVEAGEVPKALQGARVFSVDMGRMVAGTQYRGDFEKRMEMVLQGIAKEHKPVICLDEIHNIVGAGAVSGSTLDASNILKPYMADGKIRFIGSTTYDDYKKSFAKNRALVRRFQNITVQEPDAEETVRILQGLRPYYEAYHEVLYPDAVLEKIVSLSSGYLKDAFQPDKSIDLMDETGAWLHLNADVPERVVTEELLQTVLTKFLKVPKETVATDEAEQLRMLPDKIKARVFGQDEAVDAVCRAIRLSRAGLNEADKPVASLLFVGPTGVGKTEIARVLSEVMGIELLRFDMSEYMEKHSVAKFLGAPAGYVGYEEGGRLTDVVRKNPHSVLLLDEIEKAHPEVFNVLLQIMDYATVTDGQGVKADFRNVILIMTSNAGASDLVKSRIGFREDEMNHGAVDEAVKRIFAPEFRNRLTDIIRFHPMSEDMARRIVDKQLRLIAQRLTDRKIRITFTDALKNHVRESGISREFGAREIQRVIDREIKPPLADGILLQTLAEGTILEANYTDGAVTVREAEAQDGTACETAEDHAGHEDA